MISFTADYSTRKSDLLDDIGFYAQSVGGYFEMRRGFTVEFFVPQEYREFMIMKYPFLREVAYIL
jgi:hypothetical protein